MKKAYEINGGIDGLNGIMGNALLVHSLEYSRYHCLGHSFFLLLFIIVSNL